MLLIQIKNSLISLIYLIAETSSLLLIAKDHQILIWNQIQKYNNKQRKNILKIRIISQIFGLFLQIQKTIKTIQSLKSHLFLQVNHSYKIMK